MPAHSIDIQAIPLPSQLTAGLTKLIARVLNFARPDDGMTAASAVMTTLFGSDGPSFGQVQRLSQKELQKAFEMVGVADKVPLTNVTELAELLPLITPDLPICTVCSQLPLSNTGGKISALILGASCPFCLSGRIQLFPMKLKRLAWTDGRLVELSATHDLRVRPGERIPLIDKEIRKCIGGWMHLGLEQNLQDAEVPLYGFLAYVRHSLHLLKTFNDAAQLLQHPDQFGFADASARMSAVASAKQFLNAREPTNGRQELPYLVALGLSSKDLERVHIRGRTYLIEGMLGEGDNDVYRACWDNPLTEIVVIKASRDEAGAKLLEREVAILRSLEQSTAQGTDFFSRIIPQVVTSGACTAGDAEKCTATVFRYKNGYDWTLQDVLLEYPDGVDPQTMVWMWNRTLTFLAWVHRCGIVHGAIVPEHILIHPMNHGATLLDWAQAVRFGKRNKERVCVIRKDLADYYPAEAFDDNRPATPATDIAMSARCMIAVAGGNPKTGDLPRAVEKNLAEYLRLHARYTDADYDKAPDAFKMEIEFGKLAERAYGPRRYHPFYLPRPSR